MRPIDCCSQCRSYLVVMQCLHGPADQAHLFGPCCSVSGPARQAQAGTCERIAAQAEEAQGRIQVIPGNLGGDRVVLQAACQTVSCQVSHHKAGHDCHALWQRPCTRGLHVSSRRLHLCCLGAGNVCRKMLHIQLSSKARRQAHAVCRHTFQAGCWCLPVRSLFWR